MNEPKHLTWTRWGVTVQCEDPASTARWLVEGLTSSERFRAHSFVTGHLVVMFVAEYTAAGANGDDIKRRVTGADQRIPRFQIITHKLAHIEVGPPCNAALLDHVGAYRGEAPA